MIDIKNCIALMVLAWSVHADPVVAQTQMHINQSSGRTISLDLEDIRRITFQGSLMMVADSQLQVSAYSMGLIRNITFSEYVASGRIDHQSLHPGCYYIPEQQVIWIRSGYVPGRAVRLKIYSLQGILLAEYMIDQRKQEEVACIPVGHLDKGYYIASVEASAERFSFAFIKH